MFVLSLTLACTEYDIHNNQEKEQGVDETESVFADTAAVPVEEDTAVEDSGFEEANNEIPVAVEEMYLHTSTILYGWSSDGSIETIGQFYMENEYPPNITDLAIDLDGNMFAVSFDGLYRVDPRDARLEFVCTLADRLVGLTFLADGRLLGAGDGIFWIEPSSCARAIFVDAGQYETSGDIVGLPDGNLYWTVVGGDDLVRIDPLDGSTEYVGSIGSSNLWGVGYFNDVLYGFSSTGSISEIDPNTAQVINIQETSGQYWWGAASNPVHWQ
ncbi:MAG: hypothetical protein VX278_15850 [Myxococcota bacterium]|nr:hypothetical protein [Myxococcota bacterium]